MDKGENKAVIKTHESKNTFESEKSKQSADFGRSCFSQITEKLVFHIKTLYKSETN